ncbi:uncharacterized protein LOC6644989 isoform X2 [Drosophila willistoni]|uniref:uncharacterized protein LOC6644989 isoform X2 n=1 Tax=Drosophila willistoni TaxID=7260 RepID=UPI000C26CC9F|nr:uncharacterized protein LOC6644989 isoform X2 [Drosophila willistoni]
MADAAVSLSVAGKKAVLEPDVIYRIGRKPGLEFFIPDESMELAHATISLLRSGIVRFAAVVGKIWVNEQEQTFVDLSSKDTTDGQNVKLRFGNVEAQLEINEPKDKSINTTVGDSFVIPETEPQSANTTSDSCFIPETQAMPQFNRPSTAGAKRSLGDDFMIPETQDILAPQPVEEVAMEGVDDEDECSEMGTQIRICTQDFNDFDEDAIDDFDSSLILGDIPGHLLPAPRAPIQAKKDTALADITDVEMSALNWSAVNSTKMDQVPGNQVDDDDHDGTRSTPDLFEFTAIREDRGDTCTPDLFDLPAAPVKSNSPTSQPSGTKQLVVATIERNKDFIEPQAFPMKNGQKCSLNLSKSSINEPTKQDRRGESFNLLKPSENEPNYQDFIETQAFPIRQEQDNSGSLPKANENEPVNQDFIETQAFPIRREQGGSINMSKSSENDPNNQDFIETQAFPIRKDRENSANLPKANENEPVNQDYIETQAFPRPTGMPNDAKCSKSSSLCQDFIATQPFPVPQKRSSIINNKENTSLNVSHADQDLIATQKYVPPAQKGDDIDNLLIEIISGNSVSSDEADEEEPIKFFKPCVIEDINHNHKVVQIQSVFPASKSNNTRRHEISRKRAARSESPPPTPSKKSRRLSDSAPTEHVRPEISFRQLVESLRPNAISKQKDFTEANQTRGMNLRSSKDVNTIQDQEQSSQVKESKGQKTKAKEQKDSEDKSTSQLKKGTKGSGQVVAKKEPEIMVTSDLVIDSSSMEEEVPKLSLKSLKRITTTKVDSSSHGNEMTEELATTSKAAKATARAKTEAKKEKAKLKEDAKSNEDSSQEKEPKGRKKKVNVKEKSETKNIQVKKVDKIIKKEELPTTSKRSTRAAKEDPKNESETKAVIKSTTAQESEEKDVKGRKLKVNVKNITSQGNKQAENGEEESKSEEKSKNEKSKSVKKEEPSVTNKRGAKATKDSVNSKLEPKTLMTRRSRATADPLQAINLYVKSKKAAGKIKIALSMCNLLVLEPVFKALKNAIEVTGDPEHCHLLIMDKGERTFKFLMAIAANKPILSTQWLHSLMGTRSIHVHAEHLFKDAKFQELYNFKPELVMEKPMILQNIDFMLSDGILPNETEMKAIIQSAGGRVHARPPPITRKGPLYVVTSIKLVKRHKQLLRSYENVIYIKTEGVMQSLLQHNAEHLNDFQLKV